MIRIAAALAVLALAGACHHGPSHDGPVPGGYVAADAGSPDLKTAKDMAVDALYKKFPQRAIVENVKAETQVVAGLNYRFTITMSGGKVYTAVVHRNLDDQLSVTSVDAN